ncbi:MAG: hypothetical protein SPI12_00200 [Actinomycetaceae bacterium]|nr:hypothetical protein [Actinomycetaceae bacterium]MDY6082276.1 hypothetical protein [Actinomycetaceae bacterium]
MRVKKYTALVAIGLVLAACSGQSVSSGSDSAARSEQNTAATAPDLAARAMDYVRPAQQLVASPLKPTLANQGETVKVQLSDTDSVKVSVTGPEHAPNSDPDVESLLSWWTIEMSDATAQIPLSVAEFNIQDRTGGIHTFAPRSKDMTAMPASVKPGQTIRFQLQTPIPPGDGMVRWAPDAQHVIAAWDYIGEFD